MSLPLTLIAYSLMGCLMAAIFRNAARHLNPFEPHYDEDDLLFAVAFAIFWPVMVVMGLCWATYALFVRATRSLVIKVVDRIRCDP